MPANEIALFDNHLYQKNYYAAIEIVKKCLPKYYPSPTVLSDIMLKLIDVSKS